MADVTRLLFMRHLRTETTSHVVFDRGGSRIRSGRGLAFWFLPLSASIAEVPVDDRALQLLFTAHTRDHQEVTVQGVVTWRVADPEKIASRVDFSLDLQTGRWQREPVQVVQAQLVELAQQVSHDWVARTEVHAALSGGVDAIRAAIEAGFAGDRGLAELGVAVVSVRIASVRPTAEVERALQTPTRESIHQAADRATYERRASAVERERAIAENELQTQIELARREQELIANRSENERQRVVAEAEAQRIKAEAEAARSAVASGAQAASIRVVEQARAEAEQARVAIYRELPPQVLMGLAVRDLAGNLPSIEHLSVTPELVGPALARMADHWSAGS